MSAIGVLDNRTPGSALDFRALVGGQFMQAHGGADRVEAVAFGAAVEVRELGVNVPVVSARAVQVHAYIGALPLNPAERAFNPIGVHYTAQRVGHNQKVYA